MGIIISSKSSKTNELQIVLPDAEEDEDFLTRTSKLVSVGGAVSIGVAYTKNKIIHVPNYTQK